MSVSPEVASGCQLSFDSFGQEWLRTDPEYAEYVRERKEKVGRELERLALLVKVKPELGEGLAFRLDQQGVRERLVEAINQMESGIESRIFADFYTGVINLKGLQLAGTAYQEPGLNPDESISPSPWVKDKLERCQELARGFQETSGPVPRREDIVVGDYFAQDFGELAASDVEVIAVCTMALYALSWVQEQRIKDLEKGVLPEKRWSLRGVVKRWAPRTPEERIVEAAEKALEQVGNLQTGEDRKRLAETMFALETPEERG